MEAMVRDGFAVLPQPCSREFTARLLCTAEKRSREVRKALGDRAIGIGSASGYAEIVQRSPGRWDIPITPKEFAVRDRHMPWWPLVAAVLGDDAEHSFSGVVSSEPGSPAQYWHIDSPHTQARHRPAHAVNVLVALQEVSMDMGPTECARGSHVLTNHLRNPKLVREELIYQHATTCPELLVKGTAERAPRSFASELAAGSCLLFDDRLMHRGLANGSDRTRHVAYFSYRRKGYSANTHFEAEHSLFEPGHRQGRRGRH